MSTILVSALPSWLLAAGAEGAAAAPQAVPTGYGGALLRMLAALLVVCVVAYLALRFGLRRLAGQPRGGTQRLRVLERCALGSGKALWIVQVGSRHLLVGASEQGLSLISELDSEDMRLPEAAERASAPFSEVFAKVMGRGKTKAEGPREDEGRHGDA